jgi:hypothetical protein
MRNCLQRLRWGHPFRHGRRAISNEAGRCQEFFCIFLGLLSLSFPSSDTRARLRVTALFPGPSISSRRSLIRVTPTRSVPCRDNPGATSCGKRNRDTKRDYGWCPNLEAKPSIIRDSQAPPSMASIAQRSHAVANAVYLLGFRLFQKTGRLGLHPSGNREIVRRHLCRLENQLVDQDALVAALAGNDRMASTAESISCSVL